MSNYKSCSICKVYKSKCDFSKNKNSKDGLQGRCKLCMSVQNKKYREQNKIKEKERHRKYRTDNPDKIKQRNDKYRKNSINLAKMYSYNATYRVKNKDKIYAKQKEYRESNPEKIRDKTRKRRAIKAKLNENYNSVCETITYNAFANQCFNCKSDQNLCVDHHRPLSKGNTLTLSNAVILCRSCNSSKSNMDPEEFYGKDKCATLDIKLNKLAKLF